MHWSQAGLAGLVGSFVIISVMLIGVRTGLAPLISPSAAFIAAIGLPPKPLAIYIHFAYGFVWAEILYALFRGRIDMLNAIGLALLQWLLLMLVYGPIVGWGFSA